jgi:hypothetical protein
MLLSSGLFQRHRLYGKERENDWGRIKRKDVEEIKHGLNMRHLPEGTQKTIQTY